jgi:hypothetical protein
MFSSNRPDPKSPLSDTVLAGYNHYNIFLIYSYDKPGLNEITQLTHLKFGDARYPMQYNGNHFTFIGDENGIANRYAGFFTTKAAGLDTLVQIGEDVLRNPSAYEIDSVLRAKNKTDVDTVAVVAVSEDSTYTFPLTNYESSVAETRIAGDNNQVSEVTRESDEKNLYKLKIDENVLRRRNITAQPTEYMRRIVMATRIDSIKAAQINIPLDSTKKPETPKQPYVFQNGFENEKQDSSLSGKLFSTQKTENKNVLSTAKLFNYKPVKFYIDNTDIGFDNTVLYNRYQAYAGGSGPIMLNSGTAINALIKIGSSELMEDQKVLGAFELSSNLVDNQWYISYQNLKRMLDWGTTYYRTVQEVLFTNPSQTESSQGKIFTNLYQGNISYPFDECRSIRLILGLRSDNQVINPSDTTSLLYYNQRTNYLTSHAEFVHDNTLNPALNIWNGLRYKFYIDWNTDISKTPAGIGKYNFDWGFDARYYKSIYRDFIWAGRVAADFSWGGQKTIYYVGGIDQWMMFGSNIKNDGTYRYFNADNKPAPDQTYAFQSLELNTRGFIQNVANGNNALVLNSEFRLPVFATFLNRPINNAFLRNFQIIQFIDLGNAWNGSYGSLQRPETIYSNANDPSVTVKIKAGGIGPMAGGYGFGARSMLLGYFLKVDAGWPMIGLFRGTPIWYFSLGLDF